MNKLSTALLLGSTLLSQNATNAAQPLNPEQYIRDRGWEAHESKHIAGSPSPDIAPVMYEEKGSSGPSCGLVIASTNAGKPNFVELVSTDASATYPYCMNIASIVPFKLNTKEYVAVEFVQRDTREEFYRHFVYLYRDATKSYVVDESLNAVDPNGPTDVSAAAPNPSRTLDGVKLARAAYVAKKFPRWNLLERHFVADKSSSFAILEDKKAQQCYFVVEAGGAPVALNPADFAPGMKCASALASSRLEKAGAVYYLAMFNSEKGEKTIAITSIGPSGQVAAEKALSYTLNRSASIKDIKSAKAALSEALR